MNRGLFITVEGGEGAGKSTLIQGLKESFEKKGLLVVTTREPGGTSFGEAIRELLLHTTTKISAQAELLLFLAARVEHIEKVIRPAREEGKVVICDRFTDSTIAYQGVARNLGYEWVESLATLAIHGYAPDKTLYLDIDPRKGLERISLREETKDRIEQEELYFHNMVREGFLQLLKEHPKRIGLLDATLSRSEVLENALQFLNVEL